MDPSLTFTITSGYRKSTVGFCAIPGMHKASYVGDPGWWGGSQFQRQRKPDAQALEVDKPGFDLPLWLFAGLDKLLLSKSQCARQHNTYFKEVPRGINETHEKVAAQAGGQIRPPCPILTETKNLSCLCANFPNKKEGIPPTMSEW